MRRPTSKSLCVCVSLCPLVSLSLSVHSVSFSQTFSLSIFHSACLSVYLCLRVRLSCLLCLSDCLSHCFSLAGISFWTDRSVQLALALALALSVYVFLSFASFVASFVASCISPSLQLAVFMCVCLSHPVSVYR